MHHYRTPLLTAGTLVVLLLTVFGLLLVYPHDYVWFDHWDMCQLEIPRATFIARSLHEGHFPLWDPNIWGGIPVLGSGQPGPLFPLTFLLEILPLDQGKISFVSLNGVFFLQRVAMGYLALLFFRELGATPAAATIAGVVYAAGGYVGSLPWLDISNAALCTPAIARFALRLARDPGSRRDSAWLGFWLGLCWLSGHHEIPLLTTYSLVGFMAWRIVSNWTRTGKLDRVQLLSFCTSLGIGIAISSVQTLPMLEFGMEARRWVGMPDPIGWGQRVPYEIHQLHSIQWRDLLTILFPGATPDGHTTMFLGATVTTMALWGAWISRRNAVGQGLALAACLSLLYALGGNAPLHRVLYFLLPALDKARSPSRGLFIFALAVAGLAALGMSDFLVNRAERRIRFFILACTVALCSLAIPQLVSFPKVYRLEASDYQYLALVATFLLCVGCCLAKLPWLVRGLLATIAILLEVSTVASLRVSPVVGEKSVCAADLYSHEKLVDSWRSQAEGGRIAVQGDFIRTSIGDQYGLPQMSSFVAGVPSSLLDLDLSSPRVQRLLRVGLSVDGARPDRNALPQQVSVSERSVLPPAWVSHTAIGVNSQAELRTKVADESIPLPESVILSYPVPELSGARISEPVEFVQVNSDAVALHVVLESKGIVTVSGVEYPGWNAKVDGKPAAIRRTYGALRGVAVGPGDHVIEMAYQPLTVLIGAVGSLSGCVSALALLWTEQRRRNRTPDVRDGPL